MDVRFTEEQELLRASARELLARECPGSLVRDVVERGAELPPALWRRMAELGWTGLPFPEEYGGGGLGLVELVVVLEEMGRVLLPGPWLASVLLGGSAVALGGSDAQRRHLLPEIASGASRVALALPGPDGHGDPLSARADGEALRLDGTVRFVLGAPEADWIVAVARDGGSLALLLVEARADGVEVRRTPAVDATRALADVSFDGVRVPADARLPGGAAALEATLDRARVGLCAEMIGGAEHALELAVAYAKTREQFGKPIGSFQAIQHKLADALVALEGMKSATYAAAWSVEHGADDAHAAACMAKAWCSDAYTSIAGDGIQVHGGLGFTWEQDPHLYYRRAVTSQLLLGDATWHRELVARETVDRA